MSEDTDHERGDRPDDLDRLVLKIFDIIPSYYDDREALEIRRLILSYVADLDVEPEGEVNEPTIRPVAA